MLKSKINDKNKKINDCEKQALILRILLNLQLYLFTKLHIFINVLILINSWWIGFKPLQHQVNFLRPLK